MDSALFLVARSLPVRHGFTLRSGGVSEGKRASLDLGPAGDVAPDVRENRSRLARAAGFPADRLVLAEQVHGTIVARGRPGQVPEADALWTDAAGTWVGIRTADCVPLLLSSEDGNRVAAVHSGWRGTVGRIAEEAVATLAREGVAPASLRAAIGPSIGACCYEVSDDLALRFLDAAPHRAGEPACVLAHDDTDVRSGACGDLRRSVRAVVVDDDDLEVARRVRRLPHRLNEPLDVAALVVGGEHH